MQPDFASLRRCVEELCDQGHVENRRGRLLQVAKLQRHELENRTISRLA
jgi:hypothetical protein